MSDEQHRNWLLKSNHDVIFAKRSVVLSHDFAIKVKNFVEKEMTVQTNAYGDLSNQLARSSLSCVSNAVEGHSRYGKDSRRMLYYARGSGNEAVEQLRVAQAPENLIELGRQAVRSLDQDLVDLSSE